MRKRITQKIEKSKTLLIEENKLSSTTEQRKALEKTFQGLEGFIAVAKSRLEELKAKIVENADLLKQKEKEIDLKNKKIAMVRNAFNGVEDKISKLDNDRRTKEANNEKDFLILDEKLEVIRSNIKEQNLEFDESKKIFASEKEKNKEGIKQKKIKSKQLNIDIENKKGDVRGLERVCEDKDNKIIALDNFIAAKKKVVKDLKDKIDELKETENKKQDRVKEVKGELIKIEKEKADKDKKLETIKIKVSAILRRESVVRMKEEKVEEIYKKMGL